MPIRPENRPRYPKDWKAISAAIRARAGDACENCGVANGERGGRTRDGAWHKALATREGGRPDKKSWAACEGGHHLRIVEIVLTVAHLDHQPENCDPENLRAWCQRCHNTYDGPARRRGTRARALRDQLEFEFGRPLGQPGS